jgi:peptidyl-prolyl cis-trans isomerase D
MFDLVHRNKRIIQVVLAIVLLPFAFFGVDSYFRDRTSGQTVAKVGDYEISEQEFQNALRERQEQLRNMAGGRIDPSVLDSAELRFSVLEMLVRQRVLIGQAVRSGMTITPDELRGYITQAPAFQEDGKFSLARYEQLLKGRGETPTMFENRVRQDLLLSRLSDAFAESSFAPRTVAEKLLRITEQQREVSRAVLSPEKFAAAIRLEEDAAKKYYDARPDEFRIPEQVRVEYVALSIDALMPKQVDAADLRKYYDEHQRQFGVPELRQASHILIAADKSAAPEARQKARARAEEISAEVKKNPASFAEAAKKYSQDPGSAAKGGDLGSFSRGSMGKELKAFEDAVFSMKEGEISSPVESEYGYHVIRVTGVTPPQMRSLEQVRGEIEKEVKKQAGARQFAELAEKFNNAVFEQPDSLKAAADLIKDAPRQSGWITRSRAEDPQLNNPKLIQAIFSEDVRVNKRNTEAIEIAPGTIVAARVIEQKPSSIQPLEQVKAAIEKKLVQSRAHQLAVQEGRQQLEQLRQNKAPQIAWSAPQLVSRADPKGLAENVLRQVFRADAKNLPSYTGIEAPDGGFVLLKVTRVVEPEKIDRAQQKSLGEGLAQVLGEEQFAAYIASLKQKAKVEINKEQFEKRSER